MHKLSHQGSSNFGTHYHCNWCCLFVKRLCIVVYLEVDDEKKSFVVFSINKA